MATNVDLCEKCGIHNVYGWVYERCCDGRECGCMGRPITPCWCEDCWARYDAEAKVRAAEFASQFDGSGEPK
jgi:hypothetical protein